jgi:hypothetical protein
VFRRRPGSSQKFGFPWETLSLRPHSLTERQSQGMLGSSH